MSDYEEFKETYGTPGLSRSDYSKLLLVKAIFKNFEDEEFLTDFIQNGGAQETHNAYRAACEIVELYKQQREIEVEINRLREEYDDKTFRREEIEELFGETWV